MKKFIICLAFMSFAIACYALDYPRWISMPIYVYVPPNTKYTPLMLRAFSQWENKSNKLVRFRFVNKPTNANITVAFVDFVQNCRDDNAVGCASNTTFKGALKSSYIEIGTKDVVKKASGSTFVTRSAEHLYGVMLHEIGHSIGLGHSQNPKSVMYSHDLNSLQYLTNEDMKLLYKKYH